VPAGYPKGGFLVNIGYVRPEELEFKTAGSISTTVDPVYAFSGSFIQDDRNAALAINRKNTIFLMIISLIS
jgi:hypothetical protein